MLNLVNMLQLKPGDTVRIRDRIKGQETSSQVMAASAELILTCNKDRFIERFSPDGWNMTRTKRIVTGIE